MNNDSVNSPDLVSSTSAPSSSWWTKKKMIAVAAVFLVFLGIGSFVLLARKSDPAPAASPAIAAASGGGSGGKNKNKINCIGSWSTPVCLPTCTEYPTQVKYTISIPASNGGKDCDDKGKTKKVTCPTKNCPGSSVNNKNQIKCIGSWSTPVCLPTCTEYPTQVKYTISIPASNGGKDCDDKGKTKKVTCPTNNCPGSGGKNKNKIDCNIPSNGSWPTGQTIPTTGDTVYPTMFNCNNGYSQPSIPSQFSCSYGSLSPTPCLPSIPSPSDKYCVYDGNKPTDGWRRGAHWNKFKNYPTLSNPSIKYNHPTSYEGKGDGCLILPSQSNIKDTSNQQAIQMAKDYCSSNKITCGGFSYFDYKNGPQVCLVKEIPTTFPTKSTTDVDLAASTYVKMKNTCNSGGKEGFQNYVPQPLKETTNWFACRPDINENSKISLLPGFEF